MNELLVEVFLEAHQAPPEDMILNVDATDDPLHGKQEGRSRHQHNGECRRQQRLPRTYGHRPSPQFFTGKLSGFRFPDVIII